jgi:hypothetical protein
MDRPQDFFQFRNRRLTNPHLVRTARCKPRHRNSRGLCGSEGTPLQLRHRENLQVPEDQEDPADPQNPADQEDQEDRFHLSPLKPPVVPDRPLDRVFCRKPSDRPPRRSKSTSDCDSSALPFCLKSPHCCFSATSCGTEGAREKSDNPPFPRMAAEEDRS